MRSEDRSGFRTSDCACGQGAGRFESAATFFDGEHFERPATPPPGVRRGDETTSNPSPARVVLLTRSGRPSGEMILQALTAAGKTVAGVVVEGRSRLLLRKGLFAFLRESWHRHGPLFLWQRVSELIRRTCRGRGASLRETCAAYKIPCHCVPDHNGRESLDIIRGLGPDVLLTANTRIIGAPVIGLARTAALNVHTGKLPEYAGLDSIFWALYHGENQIGVTVHYLTRELDGGDILLQRLLPVGRDFSLESLTDAAHRAGAEMVVEAVARIERGPVIAAPQDPRRRACLPWPTRAQRRELRRRLKERAHGC